MILEISKSGDFTAKFNNRYLHSRYDPLKEARQFLNLWLKNDENFKKKYIIIIEPGLGYLLTLLSHMFPEKVIIAVFANIETYNYCQKIGLLNGCRSILSEKTSISLSLLESIAPGLSIRDVSIITWTASETIFNEECRNIREELLDSLRILQGNEQTQKRFALPWFENGIRNFLRYDYSARISLSSSSVLLISSGPTLEKSIDLIRRNKSHLIIAALPSSLAFLKEYSIEPDILFTTDPGYFAKEHLKYIPSDIICVSPITSNLLPVRMRLSGFHQNSLIENILYEKNELPSIPEMGTVAATALSYLRNLTRESIYIAGLDFCIDDLKPHAQPHSFNPYILKRESRLTPGTSCFYKRINDMTYRKEGRYRFSRSMDTYAAWFNTQRFDNEIYRIMPSCVDLPFTDIKEIVKKTNSVKKVKTEVSIHYPSVKTRRDRVKKLVKLLEQGVTHCNMSEQAALLYKNITQELSPDHISADNHRSNEKQIVKLIDKIGHLI